MGPLSVLIVAASILAKCSAQATISVSATASHAVPTSLYGLMFEDISHSGDGGLYAELLRNRAFQIVTPSSTNRLEGWQANVPAQLDIIANTSPVALSAALPNSLQVTIPANTTSVSFANIGFWGINVVKGRTYSASLFYRLPDEAVPIVDLSLSLVASDGSTLVSSSPRRLGAGGNTFPGWHKLEETLTPAAAPANTQNQFVVTLSLDTPQSTDTLVTLSLFSLFPPTFKNRANGLRVDIAEALLELKPAFFRFPGGNNLEGQTWAERWQWNDTVGPLTERPGRNGDWGYINTDGLGLLEYLYMCEDMDMEPIMGIWAGYSLARGGTSVPVADLGPYIQQAIDQINFVIGDPAESEAAALRARLGRPEPFALKYVEVGNEDFVGSAPSTYGGRWNAIVTNLTATFPQLQYIATNRPGQPDLTPKPTQYDLHVYQTPTWFTQNSFLYDDRARDGTTYFEGEYAVTSTNSSDLFGTPEHGRLLWPTVRGSVGEAAFMTGFERNADIVFAAAYAPVLQHVNASNWTPDLISFDASKVYRSTSYYVQKLFSLNRGDVYIPSTLPVRTGSLHWSITRWNDTGNVIIKIANSAAASNLVTFNTPFSFASTGKVTVLTGPALASNTPVTPNAVEPVETTIEVAGGNFTYEAPGLSLSVLELAVEE